MGYIRKTSITLTPSTLAAVIGYSTYLGGHLLELNYKTTGGTPSSGIKAVIGRNSSADQIMKVEKLGASVRRYPVNVVHKATSTQLTAWASSGGLFTLLPIASTQRLSINLSAASSANKAITFDFLIGG